MRAFLEIIATLAVGFVVGCYWAYCARRNSTFQNAGEARLSRAVLANARPPDHHLMNHITLRMKDGTTQIDHILVSRSGVFVIETKHFSGWIFANAKHEHWTQVLFNAKFRFRNPIFQNARHIAAVRDLLDFLPPDAVKSVVVFTGKAEFKTEVPPGVFSLSAFIEFLREPRTEAMSLNRMQFCVGRLETARLAISHKTDVEHVEALERKYGPARDK